MKIMTFNTQHCRNYIEDKIDFELMASVIRNCGAEIVSLNEMYCKGDVPNFIDQVGMLSSLTGLDHYKFAKAIDVGGKNAPYGNGLLSKYPIVASETIPVPDPEVRVEGHRYETRCLLKAKLSCGLTVMVIHFGLNPNEQINAVKIVVDNLEGEKCILMGDFNVTPDDPVLLPIRERMRDAAELFDCEKLSYPSDEPDRKIDYIFATPDVEFVSADIPVIVASDHRPHTAEIEFKV
jgi:endonuclease/exonuclease/phosphatase family metal-dependent hydrolase